ncbi:DUF927 domain-containing protein [Mariniplasma anaerobium]|nr:DUF927 domain-containing protein [Mariniplasma anaerobium]
MSYLVKNLSTNMMDYVDSKGNVYPSVCNGIWVKSIIKFIDKPDLETRVVLEIYQPNKIVEFVVNLASTIKSQESIIETLTKREFFISFKFANALRDYLTYSAQEAQNQNRYQYFHETLGYLKQENENPIFLLGDSILPNGHKSIFDDTNIKFKSGSEKDYNNFMEDMILSCKSMRFALVLGLSSVMASYLKDYADVGTMLINLSGASSSGKTTTAMFIASLWGEPKISNLGLVRTFNSTLNALMFSLRGISGVPITLDDATTGGLKNRTEMIYQLAQSEPKNRMASGSERSEQGLSWSGAIFITSETPVISDSESRMGIVSRIIDTDGLIFTQSAKHAEEIKRFIGSNYGHIGRKYVEALKSKKKADLEQFYEKCKEEVLNKLVLKDNLTSRISSKLTILYMTAKLGQELLKYNELDPDEILEYLISKDQKEVKQRHIGEKALEVIKEFITESHRHFEKLDKHSITHQVASGLLYGHFRYIGEKVVVTIPTAKVEGVLKSNYIYDTRVIYKYWHDKGVIQKQKDRYSISDSRLKLRTIKFEFTKDEETLIPWYASPIKDEQNSEIETPVSDVKYETDIDSIFIEDEDHEN